jgi:hypothetical protein
MSQPEKAVGEVIDPCAWLAWLRDQARAWGEADAQPTARTGAYTDLIFAFGLARLEEKDAVEALTGCARAELLSGDAAHRFLLRAFEFRIQQVLHGRPHTGPLPVELLHSLEKMDRLLRYVVDRMRRHSSIVEPDNRINMYRHWGARFSEFERGLAELSDQAETEQFEQLTRDLLAQAEQSPAPDNRLRVLRVALNAAALTRADFARDLLEQVLAGLQPPHATHDDLIDRVTLLGLALAVADRFGFPGYRDPLLGWVRGLLKTHGINDCLMLLTTLTRSSGGLWKRLRTWPGLEELLTEITTLASRNLAALLVPPPAQLDARLQRDWTLLRVLVEAAGGWYALGQVERAEQLLEAGRQALLTQDLPPRSRTELVCVYAAALGQAPPARVQARLAELFTHLQGVRDTYTTASHFSISRVDVVEAVVLAAVEAFTRNG